MLYYYLFVRNRPLLKIDMVKQLTVYHIFELVKVDINNNKCFVFIRNIFQQTRTQRLISFAVCFLLGLLCFCLSAIYIPVLLLKARKFALLYSLGSVFFLMRYVYIEYI